MSASSLTAAKGQELPYRFDAGPRWMEHSKWKDQSPLHLKAWPALRRLLELERWPGAPILLTQGQLADYLCVSIDTAKRRLKTLKEDLGVIEVLPGNGRRPSTIVIKHPIATPLSYEEVPWRQGGLGEGRPVGYLEGLRGPKRAYAELYRVKLGPPASNTAVAASCSAPVVCEQRDEEEPEVMEEVCQEVAEEEASEEERGASAQQGAYPGGAACTPLEIRDGCSMGDSSLSDAREEPQGKQETDQADRPTKDTPARKIERSVAQIPLTEISQDALEDAQNILKAFDRADEITAVRAAQVAELLRRSGRAYLLPEALSRIERVRRTRVIHRPIPYLIATVLSVLDQSKMVVGEAERELAARVLRSPASSSWQEEGQFSASSSRRWEDYEWMLEPKKGTEQLEDIPPAPNLSEEDPFEISGLEEPADRQFPPPMSSEEDQLSMVDPPAEQLADEHQVPMSQEESEPSHEQADQGAADVAWARLVEAFASRHEDVSLEGGWFGRYRLANLCGSTLIVYLFDAPIRDAISLETTGRTAELTRKRYGEELLALWRELSGDEEALLELRSDRP